MEGPAPSAFYVIQQDKENKCIYADENPVRDRTGIWNQIQLQLDLSDGDTLAVDGYDRQAIDTHAARIETRIQELSARAI